MLRALLSRDVSDDMQAAADQIREALRDWPADARRRILAVALVESRHLGEAIDDALEDGDGSR